MVEQQSIEADNEFFKRMIDLIPASLYFDSDVKEQILAQLQPEKRESRQNEQKRKHKSKGGKDRRDNSLKTKRVTEIQNELYSGDAGAQFTDIKAKKACPNPIATTTLAATGSGDIDDKRARLRAKIEEFQAKRKLNDNQKHEKHRLKRIESKMRLKEKRKHLKLQQKQQQISDHVSKGNTQGTSKPNTPSKPVYNKDGEVVYSKFDFRDSGKKEKSQSKLTGKDYKRLLEKIERRNEHIQKVKNRDEDAGKLLQDKFKWEAAIHKAEGEKVKDNPEILKKALKRKDKLREKKQKKWGDRQNTVDKLKEAKQDKRQKNIQSRKQGNIDRKIKKAKKKGRIIPGF